MLEQQLTEATMRLDGTVPVHSDVDEDPTATAYDLICTHDLDGHILSVSPEACESLGRTEAALLGMTIQQLLWGGGPGFADYIRKLRRDGFSTGLMKVGTSDSRARIWEYHNTLDTDETAAPIVRGAARDVTEREEAFQLVRGSEEHFRSIIENVSDIVAIVELDGRFRYGSPSVRRVLGYPRKALFGTQCLDLLHPDDARRAAGFLARQIRDPDANQSIELRARHQNGTWRFFEIVATNLVKKGKATAVVTNARDITERKLLEAQLAQANRLGGLGRLAATVAHEFNNVLMGMQPFAELMQRPDATPQIISKGAFHIAKSIQRGRRIVLDILRFSQPHEPVTTTVDLGEWWSAFAPEAEAVLGNTISVVSAIPSHSLYAIADRSQLSQVLSNLVANARDAMPGGGVLTVEGCQPGADSRFPFGVVLHPNRFVQISVRDTGHGMPSEVMDRVFEPLFTTRPSGGTGLGLAVAHQIVTQNGGYLFVESVESRGSTFHIFLPKAPPSSSDVVPAATTVQLPELRRLLIIDDDEVIAEGIATLLGHDGIEVEAIQTGVRATETIARFHPDVVMLDFGLPDMDGSEVYARIRQVHPSLPIIFATGHGDRRVLHDALHDSRTRFLQKPFEVADLLKMIVELENEGAS